MIEKVAKCIICGEVIVRPDPKKDMIAGHFVCRRKLCRERLYESHYSYIGAPWGDDT